MKTTFLRRILLLLLSLGLCNIAAKAQDSRATLFDNNWRFKKDTIKGADKPGFDDSGWRVLNLPHDWSIEDLPNQKAGAIEGPFTKESAGKMATGYSEGGIGWYRKSFKVQDSQDKLTYILFDGVYMNTDVWVNGHHLGNHPYGYTSFYFDITKYLNPAGQSNLIAVRVDNTGKNSRWYSGSGIYRHVWLAQLNEVHAKIWGNYITVPVVSKEAASVNVITSVENNAPSAKNPTVKVELLKPNGEVVGAHSENIEINAAGGKDIAQKITVNHPTLWDLDHPVLYKARVTILSGGKMIDQSITPVGIREIKFDSAKGILLNGVALKLKGGCIHHDLGPLGSASIDRAEERKIQLLKSAGYNALRLSHNPPSPALLDACDRVGMLVIDEAFDTWEKPKNAQDYNLYFKAWAGRDLESMILRDRNHPSVMMWSIGNEIFDAADSTGYRNGKFLSDEVHRLDPTRPVTEAIVFLPGYTRRPWPDYAPQLENLDIDGYNYFLDRTPQFDRDSATLHRFETEHEKHPNKLYIATEYVPEAALENWDETEKYPWFLGGFCWTAMDYLGEAGIGISKYFPADKVIPRGLRRMALFYQGVWPVYNAACGDLDLIGNRKASSYYKNVVWRNSKIELLVHKPIPDGQKEVTAPWGFPDELKSWTWPGQEGKKMLVHVYTRGKTVKLELNGKQVGEQIVPDGSVTTTFEVDYQPGLLVAKSFDGDKLIGQEKLNTTGKPAAIKLVADRNIIKADANDLSYISVEVVDDKGNIVPSANGIEVQFKGKGNAVIAAVGNGAYDDPSGFQQNRKKVVDGKAQAIIRPTGTTGTYTLTASAEGLKSATVIINIK
jgi:beta-galactosidase